MRITLYTHYTNEEHDCALGEPGKVLITAYGANLAKLTTGDVLREREVTDHVVGALQEMPGVEVITVYHPRAEKVATYDIENRTTEAWRDRLITYTLRGNSWTRIDSWALDDIVEDRTAKEFADDLVEETHENLRKSKARFDNFFRTGGPAPEAEADDDTNVN